MRKICIYLVTKQEVDDNIQDTSISIKACGSEKEAFDVVKEELKAFFFDGYNNDAEIMELKDFDALKVFCDENDDVCDYGDTWFTFDNWNSQYLTFTVTKIDMMDLRFKWNEILSKRS